ncbi:MAG TPA: ABC transporter ATP-binding protein, partial [Candidatus Hydrogenedentes bacterium]|nr:ABC transporter ATP-binding protein [Candidatus Hydrogenedentota bacterium]
KLRALAVVCGVVLCLAVLAAAARFIQEYFAGTIGARISVRLGEEMYRNVMRLSLRFFEQHPTGEILARFTNDIFQVNRGLAGVFVKLMREPVKVGFFLALALSQDKVLTLAGLCVLPFVGYVIIRVGRKFKKSVRRSLEKIASMASVGAETFSGIVIVKGFCMEEYEVDRTKGELEKLRRHLTKMVKADASVGPLVEVVLVLGILFFVLFAAQRVFSGDLPGGKLVALVGALALMLDPVRKLTSVNNMIQTSVASAERVFEFIDMEPDIVELPNAVELPPLEHALRFEHVRFSYDGEAEVLQGIDLEIKKGEMVALVGFSGAGKSTLVKLIPRFYDATEGDITIDGTDIRDVTFAGLRDQIGIVTQDTILFNESVRANIAFGRAAYSDERIRGAATAAHAHEFIERLPQGYDTVIGESGGLLSGGQRQRLAIARAIIKDPAILILDEATSSLDSESEQAIQEAIERFVVGRTTIVIAHRLSTVQRADRILVMDQGRIVEEGTHQELLAKDGIYRRLYETQFAAREEA